MTTGWLSGGHLVLLSLAKIDEVADVHPVVIGWTPGNFSHANE